VKRLLAIGCLCVSALGCAGLSSAGIAAGAERSSVADWPSAAQRTLGGLATLAGELVERAASSEAAARQFRIDTVYFRETLRDLMLSSKARPPAEQLPAALLNDMVRMAALLDAAAECQSGRYIVCPADLIDRLRRQHARVLQGVGTAAGKG